MQKKIEHNLLEKALSNFKTDKERCIWSIKLLLTLNPEIEKAIDLYKSIFPKWQPEKLRILYVLDDLMELGVCIKDSVVFGESPLDEDLENLVNHLLATKGHKNNFKNQSKKLLDTPEAVEFVVEEKSRILGSAGIFVNIDGQFHNLREENDTLELTAFENSKLVILNERRILYSEEISIEKDFPEKDDFLAAADSDTQFKVISVGNLKITKKKHGLAMKIFVTIQ